MNDLELLIDVGLTFALLGGLMGAVMACLLMWSREYHERKDRGKRDSLSRMVMDGDTKAISEYLRKPQRDNHG